MVLSMMYMWFFVMFGVATGIAPPEDLDAVLHLIEDFLEFSTRAAPQPRVSALVCWGQGDLQLWRALSVAGLPTCLLPGGGDASGGRLAAAVGAAAAGAEARRRSVGGPPELFLVDVRCSHASTLLLQADELGLFADPYRWLLLDFVNYTDTQNATEYEDDLCSVEEAEAAAAADAEAAEFEARLGLRGALVDSQVVVAQMVPGGGARLLEVHRRAASEALQGAAVGAWQRRGRGRGRGVCWRAAPALSARRGDLRGLALKSAMVVTDRATLRHLDDGVDKHIDTITKVDYVLVGLVAHMMNASIQHTVLDTWGYNTNGSWSGMVGYLQRGQAEIGGTGLFFTTDRIPIIDYIAMTTPTGSAFIFREPPLSYVSNLFTLPFEGGVWAASTALLALTGALLLVAAAWEDAVEPPDATRLPARWDDVTILTLGAVCQQGSPSESRRVPGRIVSFMLFVLVMCLYTSYSANIVALLQSSTHSIRSLSDLLNSRLDVGVWDIVYNRHYFMVASDPVRRALYRKKVAPPGQPARFMELYEGFRRVRRGLFAFHAEFSTGYHIIQRTFREDEKCGIQTIRFLQVIDPYLAIRKNSSYKEVIKMGFRKMRERGVQSRTWRRLLTPKPECLGKGSSFVSVGIVECYPVLMVLVYGLVVSASMLLMEKLLYRRSAKLLGVMDSLFRRIWNSQKKPVRLVATYRQ